MVGKHIAHYEITAKLGEGGMGVVYRARDTKLGRDVALKVLPEHFARDPQRMGRFSREAHLLASLNHNNIASIYGLEEQNSVHALVMELVEGPTLADRIAEGAIPPEEALPLAQQMAEALEYAHEHGVIHRDLKPANVKVTEEGTVKVLDFGLAKAMEDESATGDPADSPTLTLGATKVGMILGTAAYMAPEQARGKRVDKRADIWAFGVVLYEMVTGKRLFRGEDLTDTLARVVRDQPDLSAAPAKVRRLLEACLQKDPRQRLQAIGDMRLLLEEQPPAQVPTRPSRLPWAVAAVFAVAFLVLAFAHFRQVLPVERALQLSVPLPEGSAVGFLELSPDGRLLVLLLSREGESRLYLRSLDSEELQELPGTVGARAPFWSPDSRFIGFSAGNSLQVVPAAGGRPRVLCEETGSRGGGTWNRDGVILFESNEGLRRVDVEDAGECTAVGEYDPSIRASSPVFLPDGNHYFYLRTAQGDEASWGVYLASLDDPEGRRVLSDYSSVVYTPPAEKGQRAHLLFRRENALMAQPFDDASLQTVGDPFPVVSRASRTWNTDRVAASAAADGTLAYLAGRADESQLTWFDRAGNELEKVGPESLIWSVELSPDGNAVLAARGELFSPTLWLHDLVGGSDSLLVSTTRRVGGAAAWSEDSSRILFEIGESEMPALYLKDLKSGGLEPVQESDPAAPPRYISDWSSDGRSLVYTEIDPETGADIWCAPVESGKPLFDRAERFLGTDAMESQGQLSPDGQWLAFSSNSGGESHVYIRSFPDGSRDWRVSTDSGFQPRWCSGGKELCFVYDSGQDRMTLMSRAVAPDGPGALGIGPPERLFEFHSVGVLPPYNLWQYSPHPDGQRFLVREFTEEGNPTVHVITNWHQFVAQAAGRR